MPPACYLWIRPYQQSAVTCFSSSIISVCSNAMQRQIKPLIIQKTRSVAQCCTAVKTLCFVHIACLCMPADCGTGKHIAQSGAYRGWMVPRARNTFDAPVFEPNVFREKMHYIEASTCDIVGIFLRPPKNRIPRHFTPLVTHLHTSIVYKHFILLCLFLINVIWTLRLRQAHTVNEKKELSLETYVKS